MNHCNITCNIDIVCLTQYYCHKMCIRVLHSSTVPMIESRIFACVMKYVSVVRAPPTYSRLHIARTLMAGYKKSSLSCRGHPTGSKQV